MPADPYLWLEDVEGEEALAWVRERNEEKAAELSARPDFTATKERIRAVLDSDEKIPGVAKIGDHFYNFWRDKNHVRGIWRRTTLASYRTGNPEWETVLDIDALNEAEGENWVWQGARILREIDPDTGDFVRRRALIHLSRGGADASVTREFDLVDKTWVAGGFELSESKGGISWIDRDAVFVYTDFGPGTMTTSGYPRQVKRWQRGTDLAQAHLIYEGLETDMFIGAHHDTTPGFQRSFVSRALEFYASEEYLLGPNDELIKIEVPDSAEIAVRREWLTIELREDWQLGETTYPAGALLATKFESFLAGERELEVLYEPDAASSLVGYSWTRNHLIVNTLVDVVNKIEILTPGESGFTRRPFPDLPATGSIGIAAVDPLESDDLWLTVTDFLTPTTLSLATLAETGDVVGRESLKASPKFFDAAGLVAEQFFTISDDATRVPYFVVRRADLKFDGSAPTLLYGYGGFEISLTPTYSGGLGAGWLERGGVYVMANIRGGGEYGPTWHQGALKEKRHRAYEDFAAVARDLVARKITSHQHLGIQGGSNGGLLTGNMLTHYPELFGAVVSQVPLLDMKRYNKLLAGASWMAEYGDPDDAQQWEFIKTFSPYHLFDAQNSYPPVLFTTSTRDDRVHPGHARKMAALMMAANCDVTYYENIEGGHGGAANNEQAAHMSALAYEFLWEHLS
ncbi:MAG TPA: prolyl oligopeptidase family serine peptidase [Actinomycetales bacterium]|nr:prolyl oligopeptidase family serine peptidase [Actinomycetales bacterium]